MNGTFTVTVTVDAAGGLPPPPAAAGEDPGSPGSWPELGDDYCFQTSVTEVLRLAYAANEPIASGTVIERATKGAAPRGSKRFLALQGQIHVVIKRALRVLAEDGLEFGKGRATAKQRQAGAAANERSYHRKKTPQEWS